MSLISLCWTSITGYESRRAGETGRPGREGDREKGGPSEGHRAARCRCSTKILVAQKGARPAGTGGARTGNGSRKTSAKIIPSYRSLSTMCPALRTLVHAEEAPGMYWKLHFKAYSLSLFTRRAAQRKAGSVSQASLSRPGTSPGTRRSLPLFKPMEQQQRRREKANTLGHN